MDSPLLHEFKRQASFFLKEKIKTARLALTDVTHTQLLAEEATTGDLIAPNMQTMRLISRAAFEVDDYWRIVDILHNRLSKFDRRNWRSSYKALMLLEYLLTHGPESIAEEFQSDEDVIRHMEDFQYVDEKGFNWGSSVRNMSERVIKLFEDRSFLKKERDRARKVTVGIKGFGSCCKRPVSREESMKEAIAERYLRSNSEFTDSQNKENQIVASDKGFSCKQKLGKSWNIKSVIDDTISDAMEWNQHPFYDNHSRASLLSISGLSSKAISRSLEKKKEV
ncbi:clathrin interactor 1-like isoform X2 [Solanum pennellii]|uniref:Clathrin interactor 1-like isoform X2 n=1 Tax=Solanum pennellii TaxID=28526 RepID=A0ABM1VHY0_SOLPN|nr:clathrin interactor 1-like isoform X2 [Solanum pennellii]